jgi:hypothetical protein
MRSSTFYTKQNIQLLVLIVVGLLAIVLMSLRVGEAMKTGLFKTSSAEPIPKPNEAEFRQSQHPIGPRERRPSASTF